MEVIYILFVCVIHFIIQFIHMSHNIGELVGYSNKKFHVDHLKLLRTFRRILNYYILCILYAIHNSNVIKYL